MQSMFQDKVNKIRIKKILLILVFIPMEFVQIFMILQNGESLEKR